MIKYNWKKDNVSSMVLKLGQEGSWPGHTSWSSPCDILPPAVKFLMGQGVDGHGPSAF